MEVIKYRFESHGDEEGQLVALEQLKNVPFEIRRVYYIYDTIAGIRRGRHAHKNLEQILICVHGSCRVMLDNGHERTDLTLDDPCEGLYISNDIWREMYDFSPDAVLLVLASELYDESDYIRNYDDFLAMVHEKERTV